MMAPRSLPQTIGILVAALAANALATPIALAQSGVLSTGDSISTRFSGLSDGPTGQPLPDPDGATVQANALGNPGFAANGSVWSSPPLIFSLTARETGQVFGVALDDQEPANAYLAASSVYGLYRNPSGDGWADGMWGPGGGPGTVWKLDANNNFRPTPFANLLDENGSENGGAGLGGIAFDPWNSQLFASDLETGLIHRIDLESGQTLQTFDHGLDGRSYFLDVPSGEYLVLDVVPDEPESAPKFADCTDADGNAAPFERTPDCWNYADFRRRVFGLGVQRDPITDTVRLYYAVWGGAALGSDGWETAGDDAATSVWSVLLDGYGGFDLTDVRREFIVPPLVPEEEGEGQQEAPPVTDIAFSSDGGMLLAERGRPAPDFGTSPPELVAPDSARVLMFVRNEDGIWENEGRYDVGFPERGPDAPPHIRANAAGGVALGNGYTEAGTLDPEAIDATVWMSGDPLCAPNGPCIDRRTNQATVAGPVGGFQGTPVSRISELVPPAAAQARANASQPATQPEGPLASYIVPADAGAILGGMGDIALYRAEPVSQIVEAPEPSEEIIAEIPEEERVPITPLPDLAIAKSGLGTCEPGGECEFEISVRNVGPVDYYGPIVLTDTIGMPDVSLVGAGPDPWFCFEADGNIYCQAPPLTLAPGESTAFTLTLGLSDAYSDPRLNNCAAITWLGLQGRDRIRVVQAGLEQAGFDPGAADGIMGPQTADAIRDAEADAGLPATGEISPELIDYLFGEGGNQDGDASQANDQDCGIIPVDVPPPPAHQVQISGFHRRFDSVNHNPATSAPYDLHDPDLSFFHRTWRSSLHDAVSSQPIPLHRVALSQFHLNWRSAFHDGIYTSFVPLHSPAISTFHGSYRSIMHDLTTSVLLPTHRFSLSGFHRGWNSARHDGIVTRIAPLHWVQLSAFHRRFSSGLHDRAFTRLRPLHSPALSNFHNFNVSTLHDPYTSRVRPLHQPGISSFHRNAISALHNPATSRNRPGHYNNLSNFHRSFVSGQHQPLTTRMRPLHNPSLSNFHRTNVSAVHDRRTTGGVSRHFGTLSNFHRNNASGQHNQATSRSRPIHSQGPSSFHSSGPSRLHNPSTSRATTLHNQAVSNFHRSGNSAQHQARTSQRISGQHAVGLSNYHRSGRSAQHTSRTSAGVSPSHLPSLSNFHRNHRSAQHQARTSGAVAPAHTTAKSQTVLKPKQPSHAPAVSRAGASKSHSPAQSNIGMPAAKPSHGTAASNAKAKPSHGTAASNARAKPSHGTAASNARAKPSHGTAASNARNKPAHNAVQSSTRDQQVKPKKPPQQKPAGTRPPQTQQPQQKKPAAQKPVQRKPVQQKPVQKKPQQKKPVQQKPAAKKPPQQKPMGGQPPQQRKPQQQQQQKKHDQKKSQQQQKKQQR